MPDLRTLRNATAEGYKNRYGLVSSTTGAGGSSTFVLDTVRLEPEGEWTDVDSWLQFQGGALDGQLRRVTGFSPANGLTVAPALSGTPASGATYALYKVFHPDTWRRAINEGLMDMAPDRMIQTYTEITEFVDANNQPSYVVQIPTAASQDARIVMIQRQQFDGSAYQFSEIFENLDYTLYHQDSGAGQLTFARLRYIPVLNRILRIHYEKRLAQLTADTDVTFEPLDAILYGARAHIAAMEGDKDSSAYWAVRFDLARSKFPIVDDARSIDRPRIIVR